MILFDCRLLSLQVYLCNKNNHEKYYDKRIESR